MLTKEQLAARQALIDSMAAVSILSPEQMADMVLNELADRGFAVKPKLVKERVFFISKTWV